MGDIFRVCVVMRRRCSRSSGPATAVYYRRIAARRGRHRALVAVMHKLVIAILHELGNCVRPYGTGCTHEHACVRCSFLQVDPSQADQLAVIETDLHARIATARENAWLGDVEQLQLTLGHLHDKQDQVQRFLETLPAEALITAAPTLTT